MMMTNELEGVIYEHDENKHQEPGSLIFRMAKRVNENVDHTPIEDGRPVTKMSFRKNQYMYEEFLNVYTERTYRQLALGLLTRTEIIELLR